LRELERLRSPTAIRRTASTSRRHRYRQRQYQQSQEL